MNYSQIEFQALEMEINAKNGSLSEEEYTNRIKEVLRQLGIRPDKERWLGFSRSDEPLPFSHEKREIGHLE